MTCSVMVFESSIKSFTLYCTSSIHPLSFLTLPLYLSGPVLLLSLLPISLLPSYSPRLSYLPSFVLPVDSFHPSLPKSSTRFLSLLLAPLYRPSFPLISFHPPLIVVYPWSFSSSPFPPFFILSYFLPCSPLSYFLYSLPTLSLSDRHSHLFFSSRHPSTLLIPSHCLPFPLFPSLYSPYLSFLLSALYASSSLHIILVPFLLCHLPFPPCHSSLSLFSSFSFVTIPSAPPLLPLSPPSRLLPSAFAVISPHSHTA